MIRTAIGYLRGIHHGALSQRELARRIGKPDPVILEIGAHYGTDTLEFLETFPGAQIYCFEPDPDVATRWRETVKDPRAKLFELAISAQDGETTFCRSQLATGSEGGDASGSIRKPTGVIERFPEIKFNAEITVPTRTLDSWCAEAGIDHVDFIWADVQGAEADLIAGGRATLDKTRYFYTEYGKHVLYEGKLDCDQIAELLPNHRVVKRWRHDVLFEAVG